MKYFILCFYSIVITWKIIKCDETVFDDTISAVGFTQDSEDTDFVDPYSFNYDRANKKMIDRHGKFSQSDSICVSDGQCRIKLKQCTDALDNIEFDRLYAKRLINLLLSAAKLQEEGELLTGSITLTGTKSQIEELREFGDGKTTMRQVDAILSGMIKPTMNIFTETLTWIDHLHITAYQYKGISTAVLATLVLLLSIKFVDWSTRKVIVVFVAGAFFLSFFVVWVKLIKEAELKYIVKSMKHKQPPIQCDPGKMNTWDRIKTYFHEEDQCFEYYKSLEFNALHEVTPIDAFVEVFDRLVFQPVVRIGSVVDGFIENSTKSLSLPMRWMITIPLYILIIGIIPMVLCLGLFGNFRIWFGPFFGMSIGGGRHENQSQRQPPMVGGGRQEIQSQRESPMVVILERNADGELRQLSSTTVPRSTDDHKLAIGSGDSKTQERAEEPKNSCAICSSCCSSVPHIQENEDLVNKETKSEVRSDEKGGGDR